MDYLQSLCDPGVLIYGSELYASGGVKALNIHDNSIETDVREKKGNSFHVIVSDVDGKLNLECTCMHEALTVCSHAIAVMFCWIYVRDGMAESRRRKEDKERDEISAFLMKQPKEYLTKVIMEQADDNLELWKKLSIESNLGSVGSHDIEAYKRQIDDIFSVDYVGYWKLMDFIVNLGLLKRKIDVLIDRGLYVKAGEIVLYFLAKAKAFVNNVSDSEGDYVRFVRTIYDSYARVLKGLDRDSAKVSSWVYGEIIADGYGFADELMLQMKDVLKSEGFKALESMAWGDFINCIKSAKMHSERNMQRQRFKHILMDIADITNDDGLYVKTCEETLEEGAYEYLVLAKKLESLKRMDEAIGRLNEGIKRFPNDKGLDLHGFLSELYERKGDLEKAYECAYSAYARQPGNYPAVRALALKLKRWDRIKPEIIDRLVKGGHWGALIELYLADNQQSEAIAIAKRDDIHIPITWKVAELAEKDYPHDAILLYKRFVDFHVNMKTNSEYREAVKIVRRIRILYEKLGMVSEWHEYLEQLRLKNKRKVNLLKILERL